MNHNLTKSVKVDNWGVFFLQKLQNFFNKTDHCDLTLQFIDNSQLKVHRLVLSACTDYFNILENTCQMIEDVLIMPNDLQADVIVPIVNFMYTGTLEFQYNMYEKLLKTAKDMNMTVLLKLLEAHRQTSQKPVPVLLNKNAPKRPYPTVTAATPVFIASAMGGRGRTYAPRGRGGAAQQQVRRTIAVSKYSGKPIKTIPMITHKNVPESIALVSRFSHTATKSRGPSRYEAPDEGESVMPELFDESFDEISYESRPMLTADQVKQEQYDTPEEPFEKLKHGFTNQSPTKRSPSGTFLAPPSKKPNLQDVKELAETIRMRKELTMDESEEDPPSYMEDDTHYNDDYDDEQQGAPQMVLTAKPKQQQQITIQSRSYTSPKNSISPGGSKTVSPQTNQITVKDEGNNVDHAKIISEVLKKYPHLVKNNKNIKLKIMQKSSPSISTVIKKEDVAAAVTLRALAPQELKVTQHATAGMKSYGFKNTIPTKPMMAASQMNSCKYTNSKSTQGAPAQSVINPVSNKPVTVPTPSAASTSSSTGTAPRKIDAKTMHALIAKGAENMTGPWLCLRCGISGRPISIPSYKSFRKHLINVHKEKIDPLICEHCGLRSARRLQQFHHLYTEHQVEPPSNMHFPKCTDCDHVAVTDALLAKHQKVMHPDNENQQCIYCNKVFSKELLLYSHMRAQHKEKAREDGVMDFSDEETYGQDEDEYAPQQQAKKINILSNISLLPPLKGSFVIDSSKQHQQMSNITLEPSSEAEAMSNVASGIATSLGLVEGAYHQDNQHHFIEAEMAGVHGETAAGNDLMARLISDDGSELQLTAAQKQEIMSQLQGQTGGENIVMVMNQDGQYEHEQPTATATTTTASVVNQNIVVVYSQANDMMKEDEFIQQEIVGEDNLIEVESNNVVSGTELVETDGKTDAAETVEEIAANVEQQTDEEEMEETPDKMQEDEELEEEELEEEEVPAPTEDESTEVIEEAQKEEKMEEESAADEGEAKLDTAAESTERDKLISALEGDWTDEDEPSAALDKPKEVAKKLPAVPQSKEITSTSDKAIAVPKRSTRSSAAKEKVVEEVLVETCTKKIAAAEEGEDYLNKEENVVEEKLSLLGDWTEEENNSQTSAADISTSINENKDAEAVEAPKSPVEKEENIIADPEPAPKPPATEEKTSKKVPKKSVKNGNDEKAQATTAVEEIKATAEDDDETKEPSTTKTNEISTLMDDWDDDDL